MMLAINLGSLYIKMYFYDYLCLIIIVYNEAVRQIAQMN